MSDVLDILEQQIASVRHPKDFFGPLSGDLDQRRAELTSLYRAFAKSTHPDHHPTDTARAERIFSFINNCHEQAKEALSTGRYDLKVEPVEISTKRHTYQIWEELGIVGSAAEFNCIVDGIKGGFFRVPIDPRDNDLMENETRLLKKLKEDDGARGYYSMLPHLVEAVTLDGKKCNAFGPRPGDWTTFAEVGRSRPDGVDPRDLAWMFRRLLDVLGMSHKLGVVCGAVTPSNILIGLSNTHDVALNCWQYGAEVGQTIKAIDGRDKAMYAPEVFDKEPVTSATDIYMAAKCFLAVLPVNAPKIFRGYLKSCLLPQRGRPQDAWKFREEFTEMINNLFGRPEYRPFNL